MEDKNLIKGKKKGFTLIELLVVMSIMFVFMSMLIPRFNGYSAKANAIKADNIARQVYSAAMMSFIESEGKFVKSNLENNIKDLLGIIGEDDNTFVVESIEGNIVKLKFNIGDENYNVTIDSEGYELNLHEET